MPLKDGGSAEQRKPKPVINAAECKGCERCVAACPAKCLRLSDNLKCKGIKPS